MGLIPKGAARCNAAVDCAIKGAMKPIPKKNGISAKNRRTPPCMGLISHKPGNPASNLDRARSGMRWIAAGKALKGLRQLRAAYSQRRLAAPEKGAIRMGNRIGGVA
jgi:hypothetical protein